MNDMGRIAFDTNILVYALGLNDVGRAEKARALREAIGPERALIPAQALGELFHVMVGKFRQDRADAARICELLAAGATVTAASETTFIEAVRHAASHGVQFWDALILLTAAQAGCIALLSEDMQHGFVHRGVTVINPFVDPAHPLLADALRHHR